MSMSTIPKFKYVKIVRSVNKKNSKPLALENNLKMGAVVAVIRFRLARLLPPSIKR